MKQCPNCNKIYRDFDQYCLVCRYKLKYIDGSDKVEYCPDIHNTNHTKVQDSKPTITCPYCQSTNTKKIGAVRRSASFSMFGFGSSKVGKQWHCNNCKSDF